MFFNGLNYDKLKVEMNQRLGQPKMATEANYANSESALNGFLLERGFASHDVIGAVLRDRFVKERDEHLDAMRKLGRTRAYLRTRSWLLGQWHRLMRECDHEGAKEDEVPTPFAVALKTFVGSYPPKPGSHGKPYSQVAKACGIAPKTLSKWANGHDVPRMQSAAKIAKIEALGGLQPGHLTDLLPYVAAGLGVTTSKGPEIANRVLTAALIDDEYCLLAADVPERPRKEYEAFCIYKVNTPVIEQADDRKQTAQQRRREVNRRDPESRKKGGTRKTWKAVPKPKSSKKIRAFEWPSMVNGQYCASAHIGFTYVSSFWGWAISGKYRGEAALKKSDLTLAQFADKELQDAFVDWRIGRSGGDINHGHVNYFKSLAMMCHPDTGFLTKQADTIGAAAGFGKAEWIARCTAMNVWANDQVEVCKEVGIISSRDPVKPIQSILDLPMPMNAIKDAIRRMDMDEPSNLWRKLPHVRNKTLLVLSACIPLRAKNFKQLTWHEDNSGDLYQTATKEWRIRIHRKEFKNRDGAASKKDFDQKIHEYAWPYLYRYIKEIRPQFGGSRHEVFVSRDTPDEEWAGEGLNGAFFQTTKKYVAGCRGFGPHSMRHIVATSYIIAGGGTPESIVTAASALNNHFETTKQFYMHMLKSVGDRTRSEAMSKILSNMRPAHVESAAAAA
jgi:transcriptional regulator with XRE-family HTH domain/integrase